MTSLDAVDSSGVRQQVIDEVEQFQAAHEDPSDARERFWLTFNSAVSQRDAEYIVQCLRILLNDHEHIADRLILSLDRDGISDDAIDIFCGFLRETSCHLQAFYLWDLPHQQVRRLLAASHTNTSVKDLRIYKLQDNEGALWIADLLRHKRDFTYLHLSDCRFPFAPFAQILPLLRHGQPNLKTLVFIGCRISSDILLFNDPEFTLLFVNTILLSPAPTKLKSLYLPSCGVSLANRPLMAGFHKNTTIVALRGDHGAETGLFIDPILRRNLYLGYLHDMLGTRTTTFVAPNTIPPHYGLWATVLGKVGQGTQGASPVFTILQNRLATWITPSNQKPPHEKASDDDDHHHRWLQSSASCSSMVGFQSGGAAMAVSATTSWTTAADYCPSINTEKQTATRLSLGNKRGLAPPAPAEVTASISKKPKKSEML